MKGRSLLFSAAVLTSLAGILSASGCRSTCGAQKHTQHQHKCACEKCKASHASKEDGSCGCGEKAHHGESCTGCESCKGH